MTHNDTSLTRLEELRLQRELKEVLLGMPLDFLSLSHLLRTPSNHGFNIMVCRHSLEANNGEREHVIIRAVVYTEPEKRTWKLVAQSDKAHYGITAALQEFSKDLERKMGDLTGKLGLGQKRGLEDVEGGKGKRPMMRRRRVE